MTAFIDAKETDFEATAVGFAAWHGYADIATLLVEQRGPRGPGLPAAEPQCRSYRKDWGRAVARPMTCARTLSGDDR